MSGSRSDAPIGAFLVLAAVIIGLVILVAANRQADCEDRGGRWVTTHGISGLCIDIDGRIMP